MDVRDLYFRICCVACIALALVGCRTVEMPSWSHPGSAGYQRSRALQFDPYPLDDVAPPIAGGRPPEYDRPIPEVVRGQAFTPKRPKQPVAISFMTPTAAPVTTLPAAPPTATVSPFAPPANVPYQTTPPAPPPASNSIRPQY